MARLFVAVWLPAEVASGLANMTRPQVAGVRWTRQERLHVTLRFIAEADTAAVVAALDPIRSPRCEVAVGPPVLRLGRSVLAVSADGLEPLAATVWDHLSGLGLAPPDHPFLGHVTVARHRRKPPESLTLNPPRITFTATSLALVRVERSGAYTNVASFALT